MALSTPTPTASRSAKGAFIIEVDHAAEVVQGHFAGRVEHVLSGAYRDFESAEALLSFIEQVLASARRLDK